MVPALFLDRDGVINENRADYVRRWEDVVFIPQALIGLQAVSHLPVKIVIITNQSAVGQGLLTLTEAERLNEKIVATVRQQGGRIDAVFMCPHTPQQACTCRKPLPGLLQQAAQALTLDLSISIMVGDALSDIQAGRAAGVQSTALVLTGRGQQQVQLPAAAALHPFPIFPTLAEALYELTRTILPTNKKI